MWAYNKPKHFGGLLYAIGYGGVLRDHQGFWIGGFSTNMGLRKVLEAELWGLFLGLKMTLDKGARRILVESDFVVLVSLFICIVHD